MLKWRFTCEIRFFTIAYLAQYDEIILCKPLEGWKANTAHPAREFSSREFKIWPWYITRQLEPPPAPQRNIDMPTPAPPLHHRCFRQSCPTSTRPAANLRQRIYLGNRRCYLPYLVGSMMVPSTNVVTVEGKSKLLLFD